MLLKLQTAIAICLFVGLGSTASTANVILNGDFSTGDFTDWTLFTTAHGTSNANVASFNVTGGGASLAAQFVVGDTVFPNGEQGGGIFQFVNTGAGLATFNMDLAADNPSGAGNADGGTFSVLLDGVTEATFSVGGINPVTIDRSSLHFTTAVTAGSHEIEILMTRAFLPSGPTDYVDNVTFDAPGAATPLPAALPLFATGLGAMGLFGWRRKRKNIAVAA